MSYFTQRVRAMSVTVMAAFGLVACVGTQESVGLTPPSASFQPAGIENPSFGTPPSLNPPLPSPLPSSLVNTNPMVSDDNDDRASSRRGEPIIQNNPNLTPSNIIELQVTGTGVAPQNSISPAQSTALAKRAAMIDAYKLLGEKMYGVRLNGQDTVENMAITSSTVKSKVQALVRGADVVNVDCKSGLCQVTMELKLDGRMWYRALGGR